MLRIACIDSEALPLFDLKDDQGNRVGYEPAAAKLVFDRIGEDFEWVYLNWEDMLPAVAAGEVDAVWCGQAITEERARQVDFTEPYAIFDETVITRAGRGITEAEQLRGLKVGAIANSANMALAETFDGAILVPFEGEDVFGAMIEATRDGTIDAFVDDDVVMLPLAEQDPDFDVAFTVKTQNRWAVGVKPGNDELREAINAGLEAVIADGSLAKVWSQWMPALDFPLVPAKVEA
jgi:polar amino acid transport system substrate-binding protein